MAELPTDLRSRFLQLGRLRSFNRGDVIIAENGTSTEVYVILNGFVRVVNHTSAGGVAMIAIRTIGDLVGELAAMDSKPRVSTVVAASATKALVVDAPLFRAFLDENRAAGDVVTRSVVAKLRAATRYRVETGRATTLTRVARVIDHLGDGYGRPVTAGLLIDVPLPQRDLAALVGASEKSVYRAYAYLRQKGVIDVSYRRLVILDIELLRLHADDVDEGAADPRPAAGRHRPGAGGVS